MAVKMRSVLRRLDDPPRVHHVDPVGASGDDAHVVGDQQRGHAKARLEVIQQRQDLGLDRHVERRRRLVGDQHLRLARERDRDHHALAQPPRELVGIVVEPLARVRQADKVKNLERRDRALPFSRPAMHARRVLQPGGRSASSGSARTASPGRSSRSRFRASTQVALGETDELEATQLDRAARRFDRRAGAARSAIVRSSTCRSRTRRRGRASRRRRSRSRRFRPPRRPSARA